MKGRSSRHQDRLKEIRAADCIQKLRMLEERIGATTQYRILGPFGCNPMDAIHLQKAAKRIAGFIGLEDLTFIVAVARQGKDIGGRIELESGQQDVFIELSPQAARSSQATLAILARLISCKLLQRQGISLGGDLLGSYENEILADMASVFVGLGKLMLNGATGHLNTRQLAFVYRLVCAMRAVRKREMLSGLTQQARLEVRHWARFKYQFFDPAFREREYRRNQVIDLQSNVNRVEEKLHQVRKQVSLAERNHTRASESFLTEAARSLSGLRDRMREILAADIHDPCLRFLDAIDLAAEMRIAHCHLTDLADSAEKWIVQSDSPLRRSGQATATMDRLARAFHVARGLFRRRG
jgi:hypothetical protein